MFVCMFVPLEFCNYLCACKCAESRTFFHLPEQSGFGLSGVHVHRSGHVCYINTGRLQEQPGLRIQEEKHRVKVEKYTIQSNQ